jgi:hypothetical protein
MKIHPTDDLTKYQVSSTYKPDKAGLWPSNVHEGWVYAHNAIRGEFELFNKAFQTIVNRDDTIQPWEANIIKSAFEIHYAHIESHHTVEDDLIVPEFNKRFKVGKKVSDDHKVLVEKLLKAQSVVNNLKEGDSIKPLMNVFKEYQDVVYPHLQEEEDTLITLYHAYFTPKEMKDLTDKIIKFNTYVENGSFVYYAGDDFIRQKFMPQEGIPFFAWYIAFGPARTKYAKQFVQPLHCIIDRKEPSKSTSRWFFNIL